MKTVEEFHAIYPRIPLEELRHIYAEAYSTGHADALRAVNNDANPPLCSQCGTRLGETAYSTELTAWVPSGTKNQEYCSLSCALIATSPKPETEQK